MSVRSRPPAVGAGPRTAPAPRATKPQPAKPAAPQRAAALARALEDQFENLRLYREVFPEDRPAVRGVQVMFASFKADPRFVTKNLNSACGNQLVEKDWVPRVARLLGEVQAAEHRGFKVKVLEHFYGTASLALVPSREGLTAKDAELAANEIVAALNEGAGAALKGFLAQARATWEARGGAEGLRQAKLIADLEKSLAQAPARLVTHGLSDLRLDPRARPQERVFELMASVFRARTAASVERIEQDGGSERFDPAALLARLRSPAGLRAALERLEGRTVTFQGVALAVASRDPITDRLELDPEVLRLRREKHALEASPEVLKDLETVLDQSLLLELVAFDATRTLAQAGTRRLADAATLGAALKGCGDVAAAKAAAEAALDARQDGVLTAQVHTPAEERFFEDVARHPGTLMLSVDIKALGAFAQRAMAREAYSLARSSEAHPSDVFYRALAANDAVVRHKQSILGPIEARLRQVSGAQRLDVLKLGDEAVFALVGWDRRAAMQAVRSAASVTGARFVLTRFDPPPGERAAQSARERVTASLSRSDLGNEPLKRIERQRDELRYQLLEAPVAARERGLAALEASPVSHLIACVDPELCLVDVRDGRTWSLDQLTAMLESLRAEAAAR